MDRTDAAPVIRLADYRAPAWRISAVELAFDLDPDATLVESTLHLLPNPEVTPEPLRLDGEALELLSIELDGVPLSPHRYTLDDTGLSLPGLAAACVLTTRVRTVPWPLGRGRFGLASTSTAS
jgi:aminopeptidase N